MVITYTDRWNGFQFRSPVYLDGRVKKNEYDLVKWIKRDTPQEVKDFRTGKSFISEEYCYSVGTLIRDDDGFSFTSIGLRYLKEYEEGLNQWILDFCQDLEKNLSKEK